MVESPVVDVEVGVSRTCREGLQRVDKSRNQRRSRTSQDDDGGYGKGHRTQAEGKAEILTSGEDVVGGRKENLCRWFREKLARFIY